eukprot:11526638-Alexandrium_andersonii.AAC.1
MAKAAVLEVARGFEGDVPSEYRRELAPGEGRGLAHASLFGEQANDAAPASHGLDTAESEHPEMGWNQGPNSRPTRPPPKQLQRASRASRRPRSRARKRLLNLARSRASLLTG